MLLVRSILGKVAFYANVIIFMLIFPIAFILPRKPAFIFVKWWAQASVWWMKVICGFKVEIEGREKIPDGPLLVASKHQSTWETFALIPLFDDPTYILKRELMWLPLFGWYAWKYRMIPVNRGQRSRALQDMTRRAREELQANRQILIFPEGTRRTPGDPPNYKVGVARLYQEFGVPCLPIALNAGLYWPRRGWRRHPGTIRVRILDPIPAGMDGQEFLTRLEDRIETACADIYRQAAADPNPPPLATAIAARDPVASAGPAE
ncbi:MAG: lysophospholipid acyltransferase family protein [Pseudomonadota bacterium]